MRHKQGPDARGAAAAAGGLLGPQAEEAVGAVPRRRRAHHLLREQVIGAVARPQEEQRPRGGTRRRRSAVRGRDEERALGEELVGQQFVGSLEEGDFGGVFERDALAAARGFRSLRWCN